MLSTEVVRAGSYYVEDQKIINRSLVSEAEATQSAELFQRVDWHEIKPAPQALVSRVLEITDLHPNEAIYNLLHRAGFLNEYARLVIANPHRLARNNRAAIKPVTIPEISTWPLAKIHQLVIAINGTGLDVLLNDEGTPEEMVAAEKTTGLFADHPDYQLVMSVQQRLQKLAAWQTALNREAVPAGQWLKQLTRSLETLTLELIFSRLKPILVQLAEGKQFRSGGQRYWLGNKDDLNRDVVIPETAQTLAEVMASLNSVEAKALVQFLTDNPQLEAVISVHQDRELGHLDPLYPPDNTRFREGVYFYACEASGEHHQLIATLSHAFNQVIAQHGFTSLTGPDDITDPLLGNQIDQGLCYTALNDVPAGMGAEGTFEQAAVRLGMLGLGGVRLSLCLEIPYHLTEERKMLLIQLFEAQVIKPLLAAVNISPVLSLAFTDELAL